MCAPQARPAVIWISAEDTQRDIADRVVQLGVAERRNVQFIGRQDATDIMQEVAGLVQRSDLAPQTGEC
jgi:hypothetical protein